MDAFLQDLNTTFFKEWLIEHTKQFHQTIERDEKFNTDIITLENDYSLSQVRFNPMDIIELEVNEKKTNESQFYLHFQMNNLNHCLQLFHEFIEVIESLENTKTIKVLLSCSGGLTTGFFAMNLNETCETLGFDYTFNAVSYTKLFDQGKDYDVILLAPQISYLHAETQAVFPDKLIIDIPAKAFAKYDVGTTIKLIDEELEKYRHKKLKHKPLEIKKHVKNPGKILSIGMIKHKTQLRIGYRVYLKEKIIEDKEIIKRVMSMTDIVDIVDTVLVLHPDIDIIGLSAPGIINDGVLDIPEEGFVNVNIVETFNNRYHIPFLLSNDVNAMAIAMYATQEKYDSLSFLFQPRGQIESGVGTIINGNLHQGYRHFSGEMKYMHFQFSKDIEQIINTKDGNTELVGETLISLICMIAPELIIVYDELLPDMNEVISYIKNYIPSQYMPEITKTIHLKDYMLLGQMILCAQELNRH